MQSAAQFTPHSPKVGPEPVEVEASQRVPMVGVSAAWRKLVAQADVVAPFVQVATMEGEPGTGKFTLARYLFSRSPFAAKSFQRHDAREWLLNDADPAGLRGFLYLDRVDLLASPGQGLLLRVLKGLQDRAPAQAVLLASSQTSLRQMAAQGLFLPDLAFRLSAVRFAIPSLSMRREDIGPLAQALLERLCARYQQRPVGLGSGALARLLQHSWPGNIGELASVLESALVEGSNGVIRAEDLCLPTQIETVPQRPELQPPLEHAPQNLSLDAIIRQHVQYVLDLNRGNKLRAARQLRISRSTLYRILGNEGVFAQ